MKFYGYKIFNLHEGCPYVYIAYFRTKDAAEKYGNDIEKKLNEQGGYFPRGVYWEVDELQFEEDKK